MYLLHWFLFDAGLVSVVGMVWLVCQLGCIVHVLKTGRPYWWIWVIFGFPFIGLAAYVYFEVKPWGKFDLAALQWRLTSPQQRIRILEEQLEDVGTLKNRLALTDELHAAGQYDRECQLLQEGLCGAFKDDSQLLMRLAQAHLEAGRATQAEQILSRTAPERSSDSQRNYALLQARVLGGLERTAEAEQKFQELLSARKSEAPRYYYAEFLLRSGRAEEGRAILQDILHQYRRGTTVWRHLERRWFYAARKLLKAPRRR